MIYANAIMLEQFKDFKIFTAQDMHPDIATFTLGEFMVNNFFFEDSEKVRFAIDYQPGSGCCGKRNINTFY